MISFFPSIFSNKSLVENDTSKFKFWAFSLATFNAGSEMSDKKIFQLLRIDFSANPIAPVPVPTSKTS